MLFRMEEAIVKHGTAAVIKYRDVSGNLHDNQLPEIFLGGAIACGIHDELGVHAHVEKPYLMVAKDLEVGISAEMISNFGGQRADIAVYQNQRPTAIIELKKFDDFKSPALLTADRDKMLKLSRLCNIEAYLGVLITDTVLGATCHEQACKLGEALGQELRVIGKPQLSSGGGWHWCFASTRV